MLEMTEMDKYTRPSWISICISQGHHESEYYKFTNMLYVESLSKQLRQNNLKANAVILNFVISLQLTYLISVWRHWSLCDIQIVILYENGIFMIQARLYSQDNEEHIT